MKITTFFLAHNNLHLKSGNSAIQLSRSKAYTFTDFKGTFTCPKLLAKGVMLQGTSIDLLVQTYLKGLSFLSFLLSVADYQFFSCHHQESNLGHMRWVETALTTIPPPTKTAEVSSQKQVRQYIIRGDHQYLCKGEAWRWGRFRRLKEIMSPLTRGGGESNQATFDEG